MFLLTATQVDRWKLSAEVEVITGWMKGDLTQVGRGGKIAGGASIGQNRESVSYNQWRGLTVVDGGCCKGFIEPGRLEMPNTWEVQEVETNDRRAPGRSRNNEFLTNPAANVVISKEVFVARNWGMS